MLVRLLLVLVISGLGNAFGQELFLKACRDASSESSRFRNDFKWFKQFYRTEDCHEIARRISKVQSLSQVLLPHHLITHPIENSWTAEFPHIYGLAYSDAQVRFDQMFDKRSNKLVLRKIEIFSQFPNITDIIYSDSYAYTNDYSVCDVLKIFPQLKTMTVDASLLNEEADQCLKSADIDVIIRDPFTGVSETPYTSRIIGIEDYQGEFKDLINFPDLKYLGINGISTSQGGLDVLSSYNNVTHFSMYAMNVEGIENLGNMANLSFLSLSCGRHDLYGEHQICENRSYLNDTAFVRNLHWLRHLKLNHHKLSKANGIDELPLLQTLDLDGNKLEALPDLSGLRNLVYLSLGGNDFKTLKNIKGIKSLKFLNISYNRLVDYAGLSELENLVHLNLSNNPFLSSLTNIIPPKSLKVLVLNGGKLDYIFDDWLNSYTTDLLDEHLTTPADWYGNSLKENFHFPNTSDKPFVAEGADFSHLAGIEFLSLRGNGFRKMPKLASLAGLKYLDLEHNKISKIEPQQSHRDLKVLDLASNSFTAVPNLADFPSLRRVDLVNNKIKNVRQLKLPKKMSNVALAMNQIKDFSPLANPVYQQLNLNLQQNPVKKSPLYCPLDSLNQDLNWNCERIINDRDMIEADCGDWCYEGEV